MSFVHTMITVDCGYLFHWQSIWFFFGFLYYFSNLYMTAYLLFTRIRKVISYIFLINHRLAVPSEILPCLLLKIDSLYNFIYWRQWLEAKAVIGCTISKDVHFASKKKTQQLRTKLKKCMCSREQKKKHLQNNNKFWSNNNNNIVLWRCSVHFIPLTTNAIINSFLKHFQ